VTRTQKGQKQPHEERKTEVEDRLTERWCEWDEKKTVYLPLIFTFRVIYTEQ